MLKGFCKFLLLVLLTSSLAHAQEAGGAAGSLKNPKVGSLVAASMETAGTALQSDFLDFINGESGQMLAGLLYLIAICTGLITLAAGGNYKWARYLLVGPPLFFFLTQVRIASDGADWVFGDSEFPQDVQERMLKGVKHFDGGKRGGNDVAMFYQFWNVLTSDVTQTLVTQLKRSQNDRHLNFIDKIDRYMKFWNFPEIADQDLRLLIHTVMTPKCSEYFGLKKKIASPHTPDTQKTQLEERLTEVQKNVVDVFLKQEEGNEVVKRWIDLKIVPQGKATCDDLWKGTVGYMRKKIQEMIGVHLQGKPAPGQKPDQIVKLFLEKIGTRTNPATGEIEYSEGDMLKAIDWIVARSLFLEIWANNPFANTFEFEGKEQTRGKGMVAGRLHSGDLPDATEEIQQFNVTDVYQHRGDYMAAALSLPNFQGILLLVLSASYPFFALMVVVPGRAGAMLTWMSLWAWVKLWDLGFAVVMLIDDMLYALFPRGPNLINQDVFDPGVAWTRILEVDPNYASAMYYNLLATCLFAVPLVTGVFVKGGASELVNLVQGAWQNKSNIIGNSAGGYARALQAQTYADQFQRNLYEQASKAGKEAETSSEALAIQGAIKELQTAKAGLDVAQRQQAIKKLLGADVGALSSAGVNAAIDEKISALRRWHSNLIKAAGQKAAYEWAGSAQGFWLSERAVAARYSNHHFNVEHYMTSQLDLEFSRGNTSDIGFDKYGGDWDAVKHRYDEIQGQLAGGKLSKEERQKLQAEAYGLKATAENSTSNKHSVQFFNQNSVLGAVGNTGVKQLLPKVTPGGLK